MQLLSQRRSRRLGTGRRRRTTAQPQVESLYNLEALEGRVLMSAGVVPIGGFQWPKIRVVPGGVVVAMTLSDSSGVYLTKLNDDGTPDPTFGNDGATIVNGVGPVDQMVAQSDGKLLVLTAGPLDGFARLFRFNVDGALDANFGEDGQVILPNAYADWADPTGDVAIEPDGKIVVVAKVEHANPDFDDLALYRFSATGQPDAAFGDHGEARIPSVSGFNWIGDTLFNPDGSISACAQAWELSTYMVKIDSQGSPFPGFGEA